MSILSRIIPSRGLALAAPLLAAGLIVSVPAADAANIERVVSPGGIEAWLVSESAVPLVAMNFAFVGGSTQDSADRSGTANMMSSLLTEGAGNLDSDAFQRRLEDTAVRLSFGASRDTFTGQMRTLSRNLEDGFEMLRLALNEPRLDEEPVGRVRAQIQSGIRSQLNDPQAVAARKWFETAFADHPYARETSGTLDSVAAIETDDLRDYASRVFGRDNLKIAVVGDIDAERLAPLLDEVFGELPENADVTPVEDVEVAGLGEIEVVDMAVPQTVMLFGGRGLKRDDEDFIPAYILNHILGGGSFSSRLFTEVRERRGLAYSVYSYLAPLDHSGMFLGGVSTRNDRAAQSLELIEAEIRRLAEEGPTEEELEKAKSYQIGSYALRFDTSSSIANQLVRIQLDDLGIDYIDRRNDLVRAVTMEDVRRVASRFLEGDLLVTVVGQPEGLEARPRG